MTMTAAVMTGREAIADLRSRSASLTCDVCGQSKEVECATPGDAASKAKQLRKEWTVDGSLVCDWCQEGRKLGGLSLCEWRALGQPANYVLDNKDGVHFVRHRLPTDFLRGFVDYIVQLSGDLALAENRARHRMHDLASKAAAHHRAGKQSKTLDEFTRAALEATLCADQLDELEVLEAAAMKSDDLCGNFNFRIRITRLAFERFLDSKEWTRKAWKACGFDYDDLIAVQSPRSRKAASE